MAQPCRNHQRKDSMTLCNPATDDTATIEQVGVVEHELTWYRPTGTFTILCVFCAAARSARRCSTCSDVVSQCRALFYNNKSKAIHHPSVAKSSLSDTARASHLFIVSCSINDLHCYSLSVIRCPASIKEPLKDKTQSLSPDSPLFPTQHEPRTSPTTKTTPTQHQQQCNSQPPSSPS